MASVPVVQALLLVVTCPPSARKPPTHALTELAIVCSTAALPRRRTLPSFTRGPTHSPTVSTPPIPVPMIAPVSQSTSSLPASGTANPASRQQSIAAMLAYTMPLLSARSVSAEKYCCLSSSLTSGTPPTWQAKARSRSFWWNRIPDRPARNACSNASRPCALAATTPIPVTTTRSAIPDSQSRCRGLGHERAVRREHLDPRAQLVPPPEDLFAPNRHRLTGEHRLEELRFRLDEQRRPRARLFHRAFQREQVDAHGHHAHLAHRLEQDDAGRDRPSREMARVEPLVLAERVASGNALPVHFEDLVHEAERPLLRHQLEHLRRGEANSNHWWIQAVISCQLSVVGCRLSVRHA